MPNLLKKIDKFEPLPPKYRVFKLFRGTIGRKYKAKKVECLFDINQLPDKAIVVSNHSAKRGPMALTMSYPKYNYKWGASGMLGNYISRFKYLRNVLYIQKKHKNKFIATLKATYEAIFSIYVYKGMRFLPTFTDARLRHTIRGSMKVLDAGYSVMIFPEDSTNGYYDEITSAFPGFVMLAENYFKKSGEDVPVIPIYYHDATRSIMIGNPRYVQSMVAEGMSREQIADVFKDDINGLYRTYFKAYDDEQFAKTKKKKQLK